MTRQNKTSGSANDNQNQTHADLIVEPKMNFDTAAVIGSNTGIPATALSSAKLLLTVRECAAMTSLSEKTVLRLIQRGKLRCISSIRHKRIPAAELARFIRENLS